MSMDIMQEGIVKREDINLVVGIKVIDLDTYKKYLY